MEEDHQRSDSIPTSKSSGSFIRIDSTYIDLTSAMGNNHEAKKCEHFSKRGSAAEMRLKKDPGMCLDGNLNKSREVTGILPPLHGAKFRGCRCQTCLLKIGRGTSDAKKSDKLPHWNNKNKGSDREGSTELIRPSMLENRPRPRKMRFKRLTELMKKSVTLDVPDFPDILDAQKSDKLPRWNSKKKRSDGTGRTKLIPTPTSENSSRPWMWDIEIPGPIPDISILAMDECSLSNFFDDIPDFEE